MMKFPVHRLFAVLKYDAMFADEFLQMIFVAAEITKFGGVFQREFQRLQRVIKTDKANLTREVARGAQNGKRVRRRAEADIPNDKFANVILQPLAQLELVDVKRLRLRDRADNGMKRLAIRQRTHGADAVVQPDELITGVGLHNLVLREKLAAKRKTGNPPNTDCRPNKTPAKNQSDAIALSSAA